MRRTVQDVMTRRMYDRRVKRLPVVDHSGAVDGVVAVESGLRWQAEDTATEVPPAEPAPLG
jgi:hypothetical protein